MSEELAPKGTPDNTSTTTATAPATERATTRTYTDDDIGGLKAKNAEVIQANKALRDKLKAFEGLDPDEVRAAIQAKAHAEEEQARRAGEFDKLKDKLVKAHESERQTWTGRYERMRARAYDRDVVAAGRAALAPVVVTPESVDLLLPHLKQRVKMVEDEQGDFAVVVTDERGDPAIKGPKGDPMSIADLVDEMAKDKRFALAFKGMGAKGSGTTTSSSGNYTIRSLKDLSSDAAKVAFIQEHGLAAFKALPAA